MILSFVPGPPLRLGWGMVESILQLIDRFELNAWKMVGLLGAALFGCRWLVQAAASRRAGRSIVPPVFWIISIAGSLMQLLYFTFYRVDSVGIINTLPPFLVSAYNCWLVFGKDSVKPQARPDPPTPH